MHGLGPRCVRSATDWKIRNKNTGTINEWNNELSFIPIWVISKKSAI